MIFMKVFIISFLDIYHFGTNIYMLLLIAQTNLSEEHEHKIFFSQNNLSEARENFFKNTKAHHAQKDISEALEQFHSSKNLSEAHRALTNHSIILALSNRCVQQG